MKILKKLVLWVTPLLLLNCNTLQKKTVASDNPIPEWVASAGSEKLGFPNKTYYVNDYGAVTDSTLLNTTSIQKTIDACAAQGGGTVSFKPGIYLTGSLFLKERVRLYIPKDVEIRGSENIKDYPEIDTRVAGMEMKWPAALINVQNQKNVEIDGEGRINGQGNVFWDYYWELRKQYESKGLRWIVDYDAKRPRTLLISNSENVQLKNIRIKKAGFWTVQVLYSHHITVDGITIKNNIGGHGPSTDGIDIDSSEYILVQNCDIDCNDDNFCLKAGRDWDGLRVNKPTQYVVIKDCIARTGAGLCTLGSETSGFIRHVYVSNIKGFGTSNGLNIKSATTRGGGVEDIYLENIKMDSVRIFLQISMNWNPAYSYSKLPEEYDINSVPEHWKKMLNQVEPESKGIPHFKDITVYNVAVKNARQAMNVSGLEQSMIENITLKKVHIEADKAGSINYSKNWTLEDVSIFAKDGQPLKIENSPGVVFSNSVYVNPKSLK